MDPRAVHQSPPRPLSARWPLLATVALLVASAAAYIALVQVQDALFRNGLPPADGSYPRHRADLAAAAAAMTAYWPLVAVVVLAYLAVLLVVRRSSSPWPGRLAMGAGALGQLAMIPVKPGLSMDLYSYVAHGFFAGHPSMSPYTTSTSAVVQTPFGSQLLDAGWLPVHPQTPYGPLWTDLEGWAFSASGGRVQPSVELLKVAVVLASIGTGVLAHLIAERVRPGTGLLAGAAWMLSPVAVVEFAGDGHNDALAIFFVAVATWAALRGWGLAALPALAVGVLVKYTPAAFAVALVVLVVRNAPTRRRAVVGLAGGALVAAGLAVLLWLPWWNGIQTLVGLRDSTTTHPALSPAGWLATVAPPTTGDSPSIVPELVLGGLLGAVVLAVGWARTNDGALLGYGVVGITVLAVSPAYWPWYSALAVAVLAFRPTGPALAAIGLLTIGSRAAGPWGDAAMVGLLPSDAASQVGAPTGLTIPVTLCALLAAALVVVRLVLRRRRGRPPVLDAREAPADRRRAEAAEA